MAAPAAPVSTGLEERLHRLIAGAGVDALGRAQRVGTEEHQAQTRLREGRAQRGAVGLHRDDGSNRPVHRRSRQLDGTAGFDRHRAAAGQPRETGNGRVDFIPAGPAHRIGQVEAVRLYLEAHPADGSVVQTVVADVLVSIICAGQLSVGV